MMENSFFSDKNIRFVPDLELIKGQYTGLITEIAPNMRTYL